MATASLSPLPISNSGHLFSPKFLVSRNHASNYRRKCKLRHKIVSSSCFPMMPSSNLGFTKRGFMLFSFYSSLELILPSYGFAAAEDLKMAALVDDINAYTYLYPVEIPSKKFVFKWVESRKPERYSSAAPLSANARLRIVSERVDIIDNLIISISIGPLNAELLKSKDKRMWTAKDIADSVLSDKSALRVTSSQRLAESSLLDAHSSEVDGEPYWYYEYLVRKSPTKSIQEPNIYRQYVASTAERDGYLYTLNASTLSKQWESVEAQTNRRGLAYSYGQSLSSVQDVNPKTKSSTVHASQG